MLRVTIHVSSFQRVTGCECPFATVTRVQFPPGTPIHFIDFVFGRILWQADRPSVIQLDRSPIDCKQFPAPFSVFIHRMRFTEREKVTTYSPRALFKHYPAKGAAFGHPEPSPGEFASSLGVMRDGSEGFPEADDLLLSVPRSADTKPQYWVMLATPHEPASLQLSSDHRGMMTYDEEIDARSVLHCFQGRCRPRLRSCPRTT